MTKIELKQKMLEYIASQQDDHKDEFYFTYRRMAQCVLEDFAKELNIDLGLGETG